MSEAGDLKRRRMLALLGGGAAASLLAGGLASLPRRPPDRRPEVGQPVLPGIRDQLRGAGLVMVTTSEEFYHIVRDPEGWVLPEKGRYPVRDTRILALGESLASMTYSQPMTRDPRKFDRIGVGDPLEGGTGALLEVGDGRGATFAKLIVGHRSGVTYIRKPDDLQVWAVAGEPTPPLQRAALWLDLDILAVEAADIVEVRAAPAGAPAYRILAGPDGYRLASPARMDSPALGFALRYAAEALARWAPVDVAPVERLVGAQPAGLYIARLRSGLEITARAAVHEGRGWLTVSSSASPGSGAEAEAETLNARAAGWAFGPAQTDWPAFTASLGEIARI
jgi:hypothetical protein